MRELKSLTSLRGIAALAVVMQHFSSTAQLHSKVPIPSLVPHGYLAVDFFFVLSGYIMCYTYLRSFQTQGSAAYGPFLLKRLVRLLPLNIFVTLVLLVIGGLSFALVGHNPFFAPLRYPFDVVANLLMLQGLGIGRNMNGPSWSVSVELVAYAAFPVLIAGAFSSNKVVRGFTLLMALFGLTAVALSNPNLGLGSEGPLDGGLRCLSEFTLGMLCYRLSTSERAASWLKRDAVACSFMAASVALLLLRCDLLVALTFPWVVAAVSLNQGRVAQLLSGRWLHLLGTISYSLYLIHQLFRTAGLEALRWWHPEPVSGPAALIFAFVASLCVVPFAWLTYAGIEAPSRVWLRRWMEGGGRRIGSTV